MTWYPRIQAAIKTALAFLAPSQATNSTAEKPGGGKVNTLHSVFFAGVLKESHPTHG
jgi:hypothetical protein